MITEREFIEEANKRGYFRCFHRDTRAIDSSGFTIACNLCGLRGRIIWEDELGEYLDDTSAFYPMKGARRKLPPPPKHD